MLTSRRRQITIATARPARRFWTDHGPLRIDTPRDRDGSFEPILIPKHARRFTGFDDKIIAMCSRGMTVREIQAFLAEQYGTEVSPEFISSVTDAVMDEIMVWQSRPLETMYPVVFFDALRVKMREDAVVRNLSQPGRSTWRWVYCRTAHGTFSGYGSKARKAPSSG